MSYFSLNNRYFRKDPTIYDISGFDIGDFWINTVTPTSWQLMGKAGGVANWQVVGGVVATGVTQLTGDDAVAVLPAVGNINVVGSNGVATSNSAPNTLQVANTSGFVADDTLTANLVGGNLTLAGGAGIQTAVSAPGTITISADVDIFQWNNVVVAAVNMAAGQGYLSNAGAALVTYTLPAVCPLLSIMAIVGHGAGLFTIAQNAGQQILFESRSSTLGVGGSLSSTKANDVVYLMCTEANTTFTAIQSMGNLTIV